MFDILSFLPRAVMQGIPLLLGSTGETLTEKSGNLNLGIPGIMYVGGICGVIGSFLYEQKVPAAEMNGFLAVLAVLLAGFLLYSYLFPFPDWMYAEEHVVNLIEARHNASLLTGALLALTIAYTLDLRRTRFDTKAVWWAQVLKVVLGLVITLALIEGTKALLGRSDAVTALRYFLGVLFAAGVWPMTFGWFAKLGKK